MARLFKREARRREELLSAYVDGELTASEEREVEELLASSEDARRELAELQATVDLVAQLPELGLPRSFALDAAPKPRWTLWWPSVRTTGLATSVATMLLVGLVAGDMLNVLEQARFGADEAEYASDYSAFTAAESAPAPGSAAAAMDAPATPAPPMAQAGRAVMDAPAAPEPESATTESDDGQSASSADAPVAAAAQALPAPAAAAVAKSVAEDGDSEALTPVAARMVAAEPSEEPETAEQQAMEVEATQTTATDSDAMQETMAADVSEEDAPEPRSAPQAGMAPSPEEAAPPATFDFAETDAEGLELPLAELQIITALAIVLLTGATLVALLRRRRSVL